jgi:chorismate-pyruvate lyase
MVSQPPQKIEDWTTAGEALADLCAPFAARGKPLSCVEVQPARMPAVARRLLAHREHMTIVLSEHCGRPLDVRVQKIVHSGNIYTRKILLVPQGVDRILEAGIMRVNFALLPPAVRKEIIEGRRPLGGILSSHAVLRWIEPLWFVRFAADNGLADLFEMEADKPIYGRLAMIYCNGEPAVELLETVVDV